MTYKEARVYLDEMSKYGSVLGLDTIRGLLRELGNPQDDLKFIHIAGTNGKGSVLAYTSTILSEAGYRTGRYVSPTVVSYLERIQVDGRWISETEFAELTEVVKDAIARLEEAGEPVPTVFETETAMAFLYFRKKKCDYAVIEAGLGGALDATNIIRNTVCAVFSRISRDHLGVIGNSLEEIAGNKAGIIKPGCTVVSAAQPDCVEQILRKKAEECGCACAQAEPERAEILQEDYLGARFVYKEFGEIQIRLAGKNQIENATAALETIRALRGAGCDIGNEAVRRGMESTVWPGRFDCISRRPIFILDGAHNEDAALRLRESVGAYFPGRRLIGIVGVFRDKEYEKIARIMGPLMSVVYPVALPDLRRGLPPDKLAEVLREWCPCVKTPKKACAEKGLIPDAGKQYDDLKRQKEQQRQVARAVRSALEEAGKEDVILAFGSLSYLHQIREAYEGTQQCPAEKEE